MGAEIVSIVDRETNEIDLVLHLRQCKFNH